MFDVISGCTQFADFMPEPCDTFTGGDVYLSSREKNATYKWNFSNSSTELTNSKFCISFRDYLLDTNNFNKPISVTLEVKKSPGGCFLDKDSVFKQKRNIVPVRYVIWDGKFEGYFSTSPNQLDTIQIHCKNYFDPARASMINLFTGFPFKDSIKVVRNNSFGRTEMSSFKQWKFSMEEYGYLDYDGLRYYDSKATYSKDKRHYLKITYKFQRDIRNRSFETITFTGRKLL